jgi:transcriptional regulator with XRE-family HTH domain
MLAVAERKNRIPVLLKRQGLTSYALARKIGMVPHNVKSIVDAPTIPGGTNYETLRKIADVLGVTIDELEQREQ